MRVLINKIIVEFVNQNPVIDLHLNASTTQSFYPDNYVEIY